MAFIKSWLINIAILFGFGLLLLVIAPDITKLVYEAIGALFGPLFILTALVFAMPNIRRTRR
jgi:hypothetical protein